MQGPKAPNPLLGLEGEVRERMAEKGVGQSGSPETRLRHRSVVTGEAGEDLDAHPPHAREFRAG